MPRYISYLLAGLLLAFCAGSLLAEDPPQITPDVVYGHKHGMALVMHVYRPASPNGAAVVQIVSGGYFTKWEPPNANTPLVATFLQRGYTVFSVFHGSNPKYTVPEIVDDMRLAVRFIRLHAADYGIDPERIGAIGSSAGGHLALMLALSGDDGDESSRDEVARTSSRVAAVVAIAAPSDLRDFEKTREKFLASGVVNRVFANLLKPAFDFNPKLADSLSPVLLVTPDDAPTMLIHGDADQLVPIDNSQRLLVPLEEQHVLSELVILPGIPHAPTGAQMQKLVESLDRAAAWFDKHLAAKSASSNSP